MDKEEDKDEVEGRQKDESGTVRGVCGAVIEGSFEYLEFSDGSGVVWGGRAQGGEGEGLVGSRRVGDSASCCCRNEP